MVIWFKTPVIELYSNIKIINFTRQHLICCSL